MRPVTRPWEDQSRSRHRRRQLPPLRLLRRRPPRRLALSDSQPPADGARGRDGERGECGVGESGGDVQDPHAGPVEGQYGTAGDQRLRAVAREMWGTWGFRKGVIRGYWGCASERVFPRLFYAVLV
ncbi:hypothetical protein FB451DRAFT_1194996 [Mycena latifolia]|nr:hypothetical protein FB451DRAFT_1194996 [Mycena latifolia]